MRSDASAAELVCGVVTVAFRAAVGLEPPSGMVFGPEGHSHSSLLLPRDAQLDSHGLLSPTHCMAELWQDQGWHRVHKAPPKSSGCNPSPCIVSAVGQLLMRSLSLSLSFVMMSPLLPKSVIDVKSFIFGCSFSLEPELLVNQQNVFLSGDESPLKR